MPHIFIVGQTESGKSTLERKIIIPRYLRAKLPVLVYSPVEPASKWPDGCLVFNDLDDLIIELEKHPNGGHITIDEANMVLSMSHRQYWFLGTLIRHYGWYTTVITQKPTLVAPVVREQCSELYCFNISAAASKMLADDFSHEGLKEAPSLLQGQFFRVYWKDKKRTLDGGRVF